MQRKARGDTGGADTVIAFGLMGADARGDDTAPHLLQSLAIHFGDKGIGRIVLLNIGAIIVQQYPFALHINF